jgi:hypothetical protein
LTSVIMMSDRLFSGVDAFVPILSLWFVDYKPKSVGVGATAGTPTVALIGRGSRQMASPRGRERL